MKITVVYGSNRKGVSSTYNLAQMFISELADGDEVSEITLPRDMPNFCRGCGNCFTDFKTCPDYKYMAPIFEKLDAADLLIFTSPVYVFHATGQMKAFLDHFGFRFMVHQPNEKMFQKQALLISTAAGGGNRSTIKDMKDSLEFWGVARIYSFSKNVRSLSYTNIPAEKKLKYSAEVKRLAEKIKRNSQKVTPSLKVKAYFYGSRLMHKKLAINPPDVAYWEGNGWLSKKRPWKGE